MTTQTPLVAVGEYEVRLMTLTQDKLIDTWQRLQKFRTLFSDFTRGDPEEFLAKLNDPWNYWLELWKGEEMVGVFLFEGLNSMIDCTVHPIFFDRKPAEKVEVCRAVMKYMFETFPGLERISAETPKIYFAAIGLAKKMGFQWEGTRRKAVKIGGELIDVQLFGILREEASNGTDRQN